MWRQRWSWVGNHTPRSTWCCGKLRAVQAFFPRALVGSHCSGHLDFELADSGAVWKHISDVWSHHIGGHVLRQPWGHHRCHLSKHHQVRALAVEAWPAYSICFCQLLWGVCRLTPNNQCTHQNQKTLLISWFEMRREAALLTKSISLKRNLWHGLVQTSLVLSLSLSQPFIYSFICICIFSLKCHLCHLKFPGHQLWKLNSHISCFLGNLVKTASLISRVTCNTKIFHGKQN